MKDFVKLWLSYSKRERNGVLILLGIILCVFVTPRIYTFFVEPERVDFSQFEQEILAFEQQLQQKEI